jgi:hypothetical protein
MRRAAGRSEVCVFCGGRRRVGAFGASHQGARDSLSAQTGQNIETSTSFSSRPSGFRVSAESSKASERLAETGREPNGSGV